MLDQLEAPVRNAPAMAVRLAAEARQFLKETFFSGRKAATIAFPKEMMRFAGACGNNSKDVIPKSRGALVIKINRSEYLTSALKCIFVSRLTLEKSIGDEHARA